MNERDECQTCHGYGGWERPAQFSMGWRRNVAPDPQYAEWVRCWTCKGTGERR